MRREGEREREKEEKRPTIVDRRWGVTVALPTPSIRNTHSTFSNKQHGQQYFLREQELHTPNHYRVFVPEKEGKVVGETERSFLGLETKVTVSFLYNFSLFFSLVCFLSSSFSLFFLSKLKLLPLFTRLATMLSKRSEFCVWYNGANILLVSLFRVTK